MRRLIFLLAILVVTACGNKKNHSTKQIDLKAFTIDIPIEWEYKKANGIDSFVGDIIGPQTSLSFDYSDMGYANHLISSENEWLNDNIRGWHNSLHPKYLNYYYNSSSKKISKPTQDQNKQYPDADYIVTLILEDTSLIIPINVPQEIKSHHITIDTTGNFIVKTIFPKIPGKGMTGIYMQRKNSTFNFQMNGKDLPKQQQQQALAAFKTIKFKQ